LNVFAKVKFHIELFYSFAKLSYAVAMTTHLRSHTTTSIPTLQNRFKTQLKCGDRPIKRLAGPYLQQLEYVIAGNPFPLATMKKCMLSKFYE